MNSQLTNSSFIVKHGDDVIYQLPIKISGKYVYFKNIDQRYVDELKRLARGKILMSDYDDTLIPMGFKDPKVCDYNKVCVYYDDKNIKPQSTDDISLEYQYLEMQFSKDFCEIVLKIQEDTLRFLYSLLDTTGDSTTETFGCFKIIKKEKLNGTIVHTIAVIKSSLRSGATDDVSANPSIYNFHTHPFSAYKQYNVEYGPPSVQDYKSIYTMCKEYKTIVHMVISKEGIYVISLLPDAENKKINDANFKYIEKKVHFTDHIAKLNSYNVFDINLVPWNSPTIRNGINIKFRKSGKYGNCQIHDE